MVQVAGGDQAVAAVVAGAADDEDGSAGAGRVHAVEGLGDGDAGEFHQLVEGEGAGGHEVFVEGGGVGGGEGSERHFEHGMVGGRMADRVSFLRV